jgi:hypothetical protein
LFSFVFQLSNLMGMPRILARINNLNNNLYLCQNK